LGDRDSQPRLLEHRARGAHRGRPGPNHPRVFHGARLLDEHGRGFPGRRNARARRQGARARRGRGEHEPRADRAFAEFLRLAEALFAGALDSAANCAVQEPPGARHPPSHSRRGQPCHRQEHGRALRGNGQDLEHRARAAGLWVATGAGLTRLPGSVPRARLVDWEVAAVNVFTEGLLMAPAYAIPRMLARNGLAYGDIALWEIHEAFAAQVLCNVAALESV